MRYGNGCLLLRLITEEWSLVAPYLLLQHEDAGQREHDLRAVLRLAAVRKAGRRDHR